MQNFSGLFASITLCVIFRVVATTSVPKVIVDSEAKNVVPHLAVVSKSNISPIPSIKNIKDEPSIKFSSNIENHSSSIGGSTRHKGQLEDAVINSGDKTENTRDKRSKTLVLEINLKKGGGGGGYGGYGGYGGGGGGGKGFGGYGGYGGGGGGKGYGGYGGGGGGKGFGGGGGSYGGYGGGGGGKSFGGYGGGGGGSYGGYGGGGGGSYGGYGGGGGAYGGYGGYGR